MQDEKCVQVFTYLKFPPLHFPWRGFYLPEGQLFEKGGGYDGGTDMLCQVRSPTRLRRHTDGASSVQVEGNYVREVLLHLERQYPTLRERLFDGQGQVKSHLVVFLNNEDIRFLNGLDTPLSEGDMVVLLPALGTA